MPWVDPAHAWSCGPWSAELRGDEVADLSYRGRRVLRSIRAVVRDGDWNTADWLPTEWEPAGPGADPALRLPLRSTGFGSAVRGELVLAAHSDEVTVTFTAASPHDYATNRTGLVVLHPAGLGGAGLRVGHPDGSETHTVFPASIAPHQPALNIAELAWTDRGLGIVTVFAGDTFEMEDQRNWTDASFKTYSRPLSLPFPYTLAAAAPVRQSVTVRVQEVAPTPTPGSAIPCVSLTARAAFPEVHTAASEAPDPAPSLLKPPGDALLVELDLRTTPWPAALARAASRGLPLEVRVVIDPNAPDAHETLDRLASQLSGHELTGVAIFDGTLHVTTAEVVGALRAALQRAGVTAPVYGGSRSHFTELNREQHRLPRTAGHLDLDGVVTTITPLFHSLSSAQLVESVALQRLVARQTLEIADGLPVRIGPIALRPRFNNVATRPQPAPTRDDLSEGIGAEFTGAVDDRQGSTELAVWIIASAAALAVPGVTGISYFEEWGPRGLTSAAGLPLPAAEAVAALASLGSHTASPSAPCLKLLSGDSPDGLLWAVGARTTVGDRVLAANLDRRPRTFDLCSDSGQARIALPAFAWTLVELG